MRATLLLIASFGKYGSVEGDPYQLLEDKKSWVWILMFHVVHQKLTSRHHIHEFFEKWQ
jgi:hypothetical protein